jgi:hypothetical protein
MQSKNAWMRLQEHHLPAMKGMELGKRYHVQMEIEPHELSTGESEYDMPTMSMDGKKIPKAPMTGRFKVHSITAVDGKESKAPPKTKSKGASKKPNARY